MYISLDFFTEKKEATSREMVIPGSSERIKPLVDIKSSDGVMNTPTNSHIGIGMEYKIDYRSSVL